jgi:hypothetical protein
MIKMIYMIGCGVGCRNHDFYRIFGIAKIMFVGAISRLSNTFVGVRALRATPKHRRNQHDAANHKNCLNCDFSVIKMIYMIWK